MDSNNEIPQEFSTADTQPITASQEPIEPRTHHHVIALICLLGTAGFAIGSLLLILTTPTESRPDMSEAPASTFSSTVTPSESLRDTDLSAPLGEMPTLSPALKDSLLAAPLVDLDAPPPGVIERNIYEPFTTIPDRQRGEVIQYEVQQGDTIYSIAETFDLRPETLAWSNPRSLVLGLRPGHLLNILPSDGVYYEVSDQSTIADVAERFGVDAYGIIDSQFNDLFGSTPETVLTSGTRVVVPGGQAEQIAWTPPVIRSNFDGVNASTSGGSAISFASGDPGSCGSVENPGGGTGWSRPINAYSWIRGFSSWHTGVDLAAGEGTPVFAANGGRVIFAGWSTWGYGYTVVVAHGPFTTLYAHLGSVTVGCGQAVGSGQQIASSGNSGNSSGPHLHFEIRYLDAPQDPTYTMAF